jgi:hypothetical protein
LLPRDSGVFEKDPPQLLDRFRLLLHGVSRADDDHLMKRAIWMRGSKASRVGSISLSNRNA